MTQNDIKWFLEHYLRHYSSTEELERWLGIYRYMMSITGDDIEDTWMTAKEVVDMTDEEFVFWKLSNDPG